MYLFSCPDKEGRPGNLFDIDLEYQVNFYTIGGRGANLFIWLFFFGGGGFLIMMIYDYLDLINVVDRVCVLSLQNMEISTVIIKTKMCLSTCNEN